jgi:hypothetical protein
MPIIDLKGEELARKMLELVVRGDLQDLATTIQAVGSEKYGYAIGLCLTAAAYVAVDVSGRWPTEADVREIARIAAERETEFPLDKKDIYDYLSRAALGFEPLADALDNVEKAASLPVLITGSLLFRFRPKGQKWWEYLDQIWNATLTAENLDEPVLPAVQIRIHRAQILNARDTVPK